MNLPPLGETFDVEDNDNDEDYEIENDESSENIRHSFSLSWLHFQKTTKTSMPTTHKICHTSR